MPKKTLLIPGDFPPITSGIATYFYEIWKFFDSGKNIILAAKYKGWQKLDKNASLNIIRHYIPTGDSYVSKFAKSVLYTFWTIVLHLQYDFNLIHCGQVLSSGFTGWLMKKLFGIPYVIYVYGSETYRFGSNPYLAQAMKIFLQDAKKIIPNSNFTKDEFIEFGIPKNRFKIVNPGVDIEKFNPTEPNQKLIQKYNLQNKKVLLTVGRLDIRKGHDRVIQALSQLKSEYPEIRYLIVGSGEEEQRLKTLVTEHELEKQVTFCGYISDEVLPDFYNLADIFILMNRQTSQDIGRKGDYEGFGIVFLEAAASGLPVIAGNFGGIRDAIANGETGFIIEDDIDKIKESIESLLNNPKLSQKMGYKARKRVENQYTWKLKSQQIKSIQ